MDNKKRTFGIIVAVGVIAALLAAGSVGTGLSQEEYNVVGTSNPGTGINYQGMLTDSGGNPLNGTYEMIFRLYEVPTATFVPIVNFSGINFVQFTAFDPEGLNVSSNIVNLSVISDVNGDEIPDDGRDAKHRGFYVHNEETSDGCTIGVANGYVTADGRPILWKVRDTSDERQQLCYNSGSPHDYIGVRSEGGGIFMGMNEAGVATGNSLVKLTPGDAPNSLFQRHILENYDSLDQIKDYIQSEVNAGTCSASGCFPFIDADGDAIMFEVNRADWFLEYDSMDPDREGQGLRGSVVRANEFHQRSDGTDDTSIGGRYESGTYNVLGLVGIDELSVRTIIQGNYYDNDFEFVRYGPGRALSEISRPTTRSAIAVHGVDPYEDPELATMWVILGQTNYGIAVPTWVRVSNIPQCLSSGDMYDRAKSLYNKGDEATTQASIFWVETHIFDVVGNTFLPHWRAEGVPSVAEMTRIEHQIANDAYSLLDCLDNRQNDNNAPLMFFNAFPHGLTVDFALIAKDWDGTIDDIEWNFGDGQTSTGSSPSHTYVESGTYLVSCTVIDDDGVGITDWKYCNVPAELVVNVTTDKDIYHSGETVNVVITVTNNGPDVTIVFPNTCLAYFSVIDETGMPIYDYPFICFMVPTEVPVDHGETKVLLNDVWNQVDYDGFPVPPGTYYVDGWMLKGYEHHEAHSALREIELRREIWEKGDLNSNGVCCDAGDLVLMKRASIGEIPADSKYDLNNNGIFADAGDLVLMKRCSIGEITLCD